MTALAFDVPDVRAGSRWLESEGRARREELLVALLSRFNHDLRTPLNTVVGWTHLLQQGLVESARSKHVADVLARNTREQTVLLDEFVDDGRALLGVLKFDLVALPLEPLVAQAIERAGPALALHSVGAAVKIDVGDAQVEGDERRLQRLVYRLFIAVARRTREGTTIDVQASADEGAVLLLVEAAAGTGDWSDAGLLDLRISSFVAAMHGAELTIGGAAGRAGIALKLPAHR
jgi:signal transduction histidine kinase